MSQDDLSVANAAGATVRADLNANLQALGTLMAGASAPATTYPNEWWADTTNNVLKRRDNANTVWVVRGSLDTATVLAKTAGYTVVLADYGKTIDYTSSTSTLALTAAATLGDGFWFQARNTGTGTITIDPNAAETIDGAATIALGPGESCIVVCNGTLFRTISSDSIAGLTEDATPDAANDFVRTFDASANAFKKVKLQNVGLAAAAQAEQEAASSLTVAVTPGRQHFHPSAAKCWGYITWSGGTPTLQANYNITSIADTGAGDVTVTIATDFSSVNYACTALAQENNSRREVYEQSTTRAAGSFELRIDNGAGTLVDPVALSFEAYGDQ